MDGSFADDVHRARLALELRENQCSHLTGNGNISIFVFEEKLRFQHFWQNGNSKSRFDSEILKCFIATFSIKMKQAEI